MKKIKSIVLTLCLVGCNLIANDAFAQDPGFPGNDPGVPVSPIDNWVLPMLLIGIGLTFISYRKQLKIERK